MSLYKYRIEIILVKENYAVVVKCPEFGSSRKDENDRIRKQKDRIDPKRNKLLKFLCNYIKITYTIGK